MNMKMRNIKQGNVRELLLGNVKKRKQKVMDDFEVELFIVSTLAKMAYPINRFPQFFDKLKNCNLKENPKDLNTYFRKWENLTKEEAIFYFKFNKKFCFETQNHKYCESIHNKFCDWSNSYEKKKKRSGLIDNKEKMIRSKVIEEDLSLDMRDMRKVNFVFYWWILEAISCGALIQNRRSSSLKTCS